MPPQKNGETAMPIGDLKAGERGLLDDYTHPREKKEVFFHKVHFN